MSEQRYSPLLVVALFVSLFAVTVSPDIGLSTVGSNAGTVEPSTRTVSRSLPSSMLRFSPNYATDLLNLRRWQKNELAVYVDQPASDTKQDSTAAIAKGADLWKPYLGGVLSVRFVDSPIGADIRISLVDHGTLPHGAIGRTEVTYRNQDNIIVVSAMKLDRTLKNDLLTQVAAHEFGHAFGLEGHSENKKDMMYARAHLPGVITERDSNTLHLNYSLEAARADAKPTSQIAEPEVVSNPTGTHTVAACSLPEDHK